MSVSLLLLRSGEEIITEVQEVFDPETKDPVGFKLHKPFRLEIVSDAEGGIVLDRTKGYQVSWFPWAPLSRIEISFYLQDMLLQHTLLWIVSLNNMLMPLRKNFTMKTSRNMRMPLQVLLMMT